MDIKPTICVDDIEGGQDLHNDYSMIQVQLLLRGLHDGGGDETEAINDGILVYPIQKSIRILILWYQCNKNYGRVEVESDLESWSVNRQCRVDCKARRTQANPDPCDVRVWINWVDAFVGHGLVVQRVARICPVDSQ